MTIKQAHMLKEDWGKHLMDDDFNSTIYVSIKDVGTKMFRNCCYHDHDGYVFIWTKTESYLFNKKDMGDVVIVEDPTQSLISI